jgi:hypothetical protein
VVKIGLVQFPRKSTVPLVSLMRLSSYHKARGDEVVMQATPFDRLDVVYISTLFTWQRPTVEGMAEVFRKYADVQIGGPGVLPLPTSLPPEVDAMSNDYSLYGVDYGIGYSSRGCIRKCGFCPVPKIEGGIREASAIGSMLNPRSNRLLLLDNNFFASEWWPKVQEIRERGLQVNWPQGLDIRLVDEWQAWTLADLHARGQILSQRTITGGLTGRRAKRGQLHFAWDNPITVKSRAEVERGIRLLFDAGFGPNDLIFYVLIGFRSSVEDELERLTTLHRYRIHPKVMVYRDFQDPRRDPLRMAIQHWNDGHAWRTVPDFRDYRRELAS